MSEISNETTTTAEAQSSAVIGNGDELQGSDDPELHDIKALATSTKLRISQRMAAQVDAEEALLSASSPSLALRTIALPEPGKDYPTSASDAKPVATAAAHEEDNGLPAWIYAAISAVAAAAVVFFLLRGQKPEQPQVALNESPATLPGDHLAPTGSGLAAPGTGGPNGPDGIGGPNGPNGIDDRTGGASAGSEAMMGAAGGTQGADDDQAGADGEAKDSAGQKRAATSATTADTATRSARRASAGTTAKKTDQAADTGAATSGDSVASADKSSAVKKPEKKPDALEDLLAEASGGAAGTGTTGAGTAGSGQQTGAAAPARTQLERGDIKKAMTPIGPKAQACYDKTQLSGMVTVMIDFRVEPSGAISSASAKGKFKGTPTGDCVASAVKTATLPAYDGAPMTFTYPFLLTQ